MYATAIPQRGFKMSDPISIPGLITTIAGSLAAIATGFLVLRKNLSNDSVAREANGGETDVIKLLREQLAIERERTKNMSDALDTANKKVLDLCAQIVNLSSQVSTLQAQVQRMSPTPIISPIPPA